jgi:UPF0716 protein FxsA
LEVFVIVSVGQVIGGWETVGLLFAMSVLGTYVVRREGAAAWRELQGALGSGRIPGRELADAALVLVGGTLLLTPGFLTDVVGLFFLLPFTRPVARRLLIGTVARRLTVVGVGGRSRTGARAPGRHPEGDRHRPPGPQGRTGPPGRGWTPAGGRVVAGEVIRDDTGAGDIRDARDGEGGGHDRGTR